MTLTVRIPHFISCPVNARRRENVAADGLAAETAAV